MPPEEMKEMNLLNEGKQDLKRARLHEMLERSCWQRPMTKRISL